jgi:hypothetical protein
MMRATTHAHMRCQQDGRDDRDELALQHKHSLTRFSSSIDRPRQRVKLNCAVWQTPESCQPPGIQTKQCLHKQRTIQPARLRRSFPPPW